MNKSVLVIISTLILVSGCSGTLPKLGVNNTDLTPCPSSPNCVSSQSANKDHYIQAIEYSGTQKQAHGRLLQILKSLNRINIITNQESYIQVEFTSALFRFVDDVEFYFSKEQSGKTIIHIRSASRLGYSDLGANRKRMELIRSKFNQ